MSDEAAVSLQRVLNRYHVWDARKILRLLPREECVDVTITSPPYWNLKDYGVSSQIGFGQTYDQCLEELREVFTYVYKVTNWSQTTEEVKLKWEDAGVVVLSCLEDCVTCLPVPFANRLNKQRL
jgi:DNA modification methylase